MSQADIGMLMNLSQAGYMHKENGIRIFTFNEAVKLCSDLEIDPCFLVSEMTIDLADLKGQARGLRDKILKNLDTLNAKQLVALDEYIKQL